jgi:hypothetical protein
MAGINMAMMHWPEVIPFPSRDLPSMGNQKTLTVARTGYWEKDLVDPKVDNLKFDAALHYRFNPSTTN